jgi:hypothetical protein
MYGKCDETRDRLIYNYLISSKFPSLFDSKMPKRQPMVDLLKFIPTCHFT